MLEKTYLFNKAHMTDTINREARQSNKGPRLQRLRAVFHVLEALEKKDNAHVYAAIEHIEDVYVRDCDDCNDLIEEDKNYDLDSSFTFASDEILNTLVAFLDNYFMWECSPKLVMGFYSTNKVGKERESARTKSLAIDLPDTSVLMLLKEKKHTHPNFLKTVKLLVIDEYKKQYRAKKKTGNLNAIYAFTDEDWKDFLSCLKWEFGQPNEVKLKENLLCKIRESQHFIKSSLDGKEEIILSRLLDLFDDRQNSTEKMDRFVNGSDVKLCFKEVQGGLQGYEKRTDPVWQDWRRLPPPVDKRSLPEKVTSVCSDYSIVKITRLARKVGAARSLGSSFPDEKLYHAIKYRVFDCCEDKLIALAKTIDWSGVLNDHLVDKVLSELTEAATLYIDDMSNAFDYNYDINIMVSGIVLELFDECFLSLDLDAYA